MSRQLIDVEVQVLNQPNKNNRIYTTEVGNELVRQFKEMQAKGKPLLGTLGNIVTAENCISIPLDQVSHEVTSLSIKNDVLVADIDIFDYPRSRELEKMLDEGVTIGFRLGVLCDIRRHSEHTVLVSGIVLITIFATDNPA